MYFSFSKWLKENFSLVATSLGFTLDSITLIALINSKTPPSIPFIDYPLGVTAQITIFAITAITYLGFLQEYWHQLRQKYVLETERYTFLGFIVFDMFLFFKYPFLLIPIIILVGFLCIIIPQLISFQYLGIAIIIFCVILYLSFNLEKSIIKREWEEVIEYKVKELSLESRVSSRWINRINKELAQVGYVSDLNLSNMYGHSRSIARKALRSYYEESEGEHELVLVKEKVKLKKNGLGPIEVMVLAHRNLFESKPWL
ncbi:hypothetical protein Ava_0358 [Trichormus variabilis ATCC 29413]|uniref:Uncharacterized protein n=4 Tax=Anabaena variabilis TaxID=264691 RepID=Q3MGA2_TRIV2|nr:MULTISPECIES: hypothetical protein [Nostocaceae]ABA19984.1 hypothetical protein Ava_0358 [Trichormus variabilis ATCC 29413]MBC1216440.1 hypothetical protein [Trichormus variabilis ARAD]MBC1268422.1 hypothetical protein [Trichormus variabilis FSR]MBC1313740.1 hypothetical protein [Trichormus variabilis PNB]MBC1328931.1 hypothetical protein [Trichormus variabilis 9RC]